MADTIIHNTRAPERNSSNSSEWIVAVIISVAIVVIGFMLYRAGLFSASVPANEGTNINVTLPNPVTNEGGPAPAE